MLKKYAILAVVLGFIITLSGCATTRKKGDLEMQGLKNEITALEAQIQTKDEEIASMKDELDRVIAERETLAAEKSSLSAAPLKHAKKKKVIGEIKSRPNAKQIQVALLNAGYNSGSIDGKMGDQTRDAIKAFQRANGLHADGTAGKDTWKLLRPYLYKKIK